MTRARFSIVSAVYNVAAYLPQFISSLEAQTVDHDDLEIVMVDDGSTDGSAGILAQWQRRTALSVRILTQSNSGQGAARNAGIDVSSGDWISFADPDDFFHPEYFQRLADLLDANPEASMVAARVITYDEGADRYRDEHPLTWRFKEGDRVVDLNSEPDYFQLFVSSAVFRLNRIQELDLTFDSRIRPNFEDGHFIARYLLGEEHPRIAFAAMAKYFYRRRADNSSAIQTAWHQPQKFTDLLQYGYLDLLQRTAAQGAPGWLQSMVIYELGWYLRNEEVLFGGPTASDFDVADEFHDLMAQITGYLDPDRIWQYRSFSLLPSRRAVLAHGYAERPWRASEFRIEDRDQAQGLVRISYRYTGAAPAERLMLDGDQIEPRHAKTRSVSYSGRALLYERILWLTDAPGVQVWLDDVRLQEQRRASTQAEVPAFGGRGLTGAARSAAKLVLGRNDPRGRGVTGLLERIRDRNITRRLRNKVVAVTRKLLQLDRTRDSDAVFEGAWILLDRITEAGDNAEHLFRYLRQHRPDVNAWFAIAAGSVDWDRLTTEFGDRVLAYGSSRWQRAALHARFVVSSHADRHVYDPEEFEGRRRRPGWRFVFLQHGVIFNDLSRWLNFKPIAMMVTTTPAEFSAVVGDGSPYRWTTKEVVRTGMPRLERLLTLTQSITPTTVTIMPTWREYLRGKKVRGKHIHERITDFTDTDYAVAWQAVLDDPALVTLANKNNVDIVFMPHPNIQPYLSEFRIPKHVRVARYGVDDVQEVLAATRVLVTDYSSVAFDAAALDRPTVYLRFDEDRVYTGGHITRRGYFDVQRDGFGPVVQRPEQVAEAVSGVLSEPELFADRRRRAFPGDLDNSCEAVTSAIEAMEPRERSGGFDG